MNDDYDNWLNKGTTRYYTKLVYTNGRFMQITIDRENLFDRFHNVVNEAERIVRGGG